MAEVGRLVQVAAAADGCARVRAYDGMRGKLGLGAVQRGIADSARELRVIDPSATLYSTASTRCSALSATYYARGDAYYREERRVRGRHRLRRWDRRWILRGGDRNFFLLPDATRGGGRPRIFVNGGKERARVASLFEEGFLLKLLGRSQGRGDATRGYWRRCEEPMRWDWKWFLG